jgi:RNA polymerase sigma factor (sigma-70 family)
VLRKDTQAFVAELYREQNQKLLGFLAHRVRNARMHAADLAQEIYLRLSRISRPHTIREPQVYLFKVARNVIHDHEFSLAATPPSSDIAEMADTLESDAVDPALSVDQRQRLDRIQHVLNELPPRARAVFTLHRAYGHTLDEIASQFGISRSQVKKDFAKAVAYLNQRLQMEP